MAVQKGITLEELHALLKEPESASLECKEAKGHYPVSSLGEYCCAIANAGGGHVLLGVNDKVPREVVGTSAYSNLEIPNIEAELADDLSPAIRIEISEHMLDEGRVVAVKIPSRDEGKPVRHRGDLYTRTGNQKRKMTDHELNRILTEAQVKSIPTGHWLDEVCVVDRSKQEVMDLLDVAKYYEMTGEPMPAESDSVMDELTADGILASARAGFSITRMGALLLARSIKRCSPCVEGKRFEIMRFEGRDKTKGILFSQCFDTGYATGFDNMLNVAMEQMEVEDAGEQASAAEIAPRLAVRELLANAIIHQNFEENSRAVLRIFSHKAELLNPGTSLVATDLMMHNSKSRNVRMLSLMRKLSLAEYASSGVEKIIAAIEENKSAPPVFKSLGDFTHIELSRNADYDKMPWDERETAGHQHCLLKHSRGEVMTNSSLKGRFKISDDATQEISLLLKSLVDDKKIKEAPPALHGSDQEIGYVPYWAI